MALCMLHAFLPRCRNSLGGKGAEEIPNLLMGGVWVDAGAGDPAAQGDNPQGKACHREGLER